jgi:DNA-nicking Smr family endonuclease
MSRRKITDEEKTLFRKTVDTPRVLKAVMPKALEKANKAKTKQAKADKAKAKKPASPRSCTLDGHTAEKLKRGAVAPQARIDLHGMTEAHAHQHLLAALRRAQRDQVRMALVITGIGNPKRDEGAVWMARTHGVLKQMVPRWLAEMAFAALVTGSGPAHLRHGGDGALYVYLRKAP